MALRTYLQKNENEAVGVVGNYYLRVDNLPPIGIQELAELIHLHNIGQSTGTIFGILKDAVTIIRQQVLMGQPVKIDDLAIFKASVENCGGWSDLKSVNLHIGGEKDNVKSIRLLAQATGDFTKAELSKDGKLVLDRQSQQMVKEAGGNPEGSDTTTTDTTTTGSDTDGSQQQGGSPVLTIAKSGTGTMTLTDQSGHQVESGTAVTAGQTLTLSVTPAGSATPTATIGTQTVTLTEDEGQWVGTFQMPATSATLTVRTGGTGDNEE